MADFSSNLPVGLTGLNITSVPTYPINADSGGNMYVRDVTAGPVTPGTAASYAALMAGQYNSTLPTLTNTQQSAIQIDSSGRVIISPLTSASTVTANQGTPNTLANAWSEKITDGTNGPVAVKPANTSPISTDPALVVTLSPNSSSLGATTGSGTISALNGTVVAVAGGAVTFSLSGTWVGTLTIQAQNGDGQWWNVAALSNQTGLIQNTTSQNGVMEMNAAGWTQARMIATSWTSGTVTVTWASTGGMHDIITYSSNPANFYATAYLNDGSGNPITSSNNGYANQQLLNVQVPNTTVAPVALAALNASVSIAMAGLQTVGFQMAAGTFIGTITPQCSIDGGTSWMTCSFLNPSTGNVTSSFTFSSANTLTVLGVIPVGGSTNVRVLVTAYTSGTASCILSASQTLAATSQPGAAQGSGTITALNGTVVASTAGYGSAFFDITGTWVGTLTLQAQNGDGVWYNILAYFASTGSYASNSTTVNTTVQLNCAGYIQTRVIATAWTSGTATISWSATAYPHQIQIYNPSSAANVLTQAYTFDGSGSAIGSTANAGSSLYTVKPDSSTTGTLGALNATLNLPINDVSSAYALISGTWVGTIQFQGSVNGTNFVPLEAVQGGPTNAYSTTGFTANGGVRIALPAGFTSIQAVMTAYTSGTATVVINSSAAPANVEVVQFNAANLNASIGSIVTDLDKTITGTITALNGTVVIATNGTSSVNASISGTWVATLVMEGQSGDGIWYALAVGNPNGGQNISSFTTNNLYTVGSGGFTQVRIRASAYTSGTINVTMDASSGSAQTLAVDANGNQQIVGNVASGTTDSGNGVKVSAVYNSALPTFTNGQRADNQSDANGAQIVSTKVPRTYSAPQTASVGTTSTLILAANPNRKGLYLSNTTATQQISLGFNGNAAAYQYGITLFPGQKFWMDEYSFSTGAIYAITSGAATYIGIQEIT